MDALKKSQADQGIDISIARGPGKKGLKGMYLICRHLHVEDRGVGGAEEVHEQVADHFSANGKTLEFPLSKSPAYPPVIVENPVGVQREAPDHFVVDYAKGVVTFRIPPSRSSKVLINYRIPRTAGETQILIAQLSYTLEIHSDDADERDDLTVHAIKAIYRALPELARHGISDIRSVQAYAAHDDGVINTLDFQVETTIDVEKPVPPIESVEIERTSI